MIDDEGYEISCKERTRIRDERINDAYKELVLQIQIAIKEWIEKHDELFYKP